MKKEKFVSDPVTEAMHKRAKELGIRTVWERYKENHARSKDAPFQATCTTCQQGPCVDVKRTGVCGMNRDVIIAKNLVSETTIGASAHVGHARRIANILKGVGDGSISGYPIIDHEKLDSVYEGLGLDGARTDREKAAWVADAIMDDLSKLDGAPKMLLFKASEERRNLWEGEEILIDGGCPEIMEAQNRIAMGMDHDMENLLLGACRLGLVDAYCGMYPATMVQDILLGVPKAGQVKTNLTVIESDMINVVIHGHIPFLPDVVVRAAEEYNDDQGHEPKVNVVGMCCTGMEVLMRRGINFGGDILQQELAIATGAIELVVADIQCTQPAIVDAAKHFHTKIATTDPMAKMEGTTYIEFEPKRATEIGRELIKMAVDNYAMRDHAKVFIPDYEPHEMMFGFSTEQLIESLDKVKPGDPIGALVDNIKNGNIRGIAAVIGCVTPRDDYGYRTVELIRELIKNNVLVVLTGCVATIASYWDLLKPDPAYPGVGESLAAVMDAIAKANGLEAVPPCLFMGSCVDNSRIEEVLNAVADYLGVRIDQLPIAGSAPEYIAEKAIPIGFWTVSLGVFTHIGDQPNVAASKRVVKWLTGDVEKIFGGKFYVEADPYKSAEKLIEVIEDKRKSLGL
ncbi:MAG: carbon-monoxide dehydrogenase catalytic subunit [Candidatus Methanogaster sp.]|uniref:Carbon-monoxide dehydrogenase catalytic subunit n=1 Tax=Candidatus Methanogaster sp. TaxID=3386292 RepID=A0AC61KYD2_9EURY|nr:MAG: carbon-monoxide dehydrogenase catalytic subunit [ANME-2 cluster archaeon]